MRHHRAIIIFSIILATASVSRAQIRKSSECEPCKRPGELSNFLDSTMDVQFVGGSLMRGVRSAARTTMPGFRGKQQAYRLTYIEGGICRDTIISADVVVSFSHEGIGGTHDPLRYPVAPAREAYDLNSAQTNRSFVEIGALFGYGGSDTSSRKIGFRSTYYGLEAIVAPLGDALGEHLSLGIGGGAMIEGGRMRFPLFTHLRYDLFSNGKPTTVTHYIPDSCQFRTPQTTEMATVPNGFIERPMLRTDSSVIFVEESKAIRPSFRPFVFVEGGSVFDGKFNGSGVPANAVNPDERKPLLLGAGIGVPIADVVILTLSYRYLQLHLATPCEQCIDRSVINRNTIHSIALKGAYRISW